MRRAPVSIVILAWNAWAETQACLETLRPTLGVSDQVIVVDNGSTDGTGTRLRAYPWIEVLTNSENRGFAGGCNQGAALATNDTIIFLNNDTILAGRWIDALVEPFSDARVGATGPRSNFVSGAQLVRPVPYPAGDRAAMRAFAREWSDGHRGKYRLTTRLVGFCLAVRRSAFAAIGGFDEGYEIGGCEDDDLCRRLIDAQWLLLLADACFVHHEGHKTFAANDVDWLAQQHVNARRLEQKFRDATPQRASLVSAAIIARNESATIAACIQSLRTIVDEIVVYDTGSTDDTTNVARLLGATVVEGEWHGDFSKARNAAMEHCTGQWVLSIDADEVAVCDAPHQLHDFLVAAAPSLPAYSVTIEHGGPELALAKVALADDATSPSSPPAIPGALRTEAVRLVRRGAARWEGAVLERLVSAAGARSLIVEHLELLSLRHGGHAELLGRRTSSAEDLGEVSHVDRFETGFSAGTLAAAYLAGGRDSDALAAADAALELASRPLHRAAALRVRAAALTRLGRPREALRAVAELRELPENGEHADELEIHALCADGRLEEALALLDNTRRATPSAAVAVTERRAEVLGLLGRWDEAADTLVALTPNQERSHGWLSGTLAALEGAGRSAVEIARAIPRDRLVMLFGSLRHGGSEANLRLLDACYEEFPAERLQILAATAPFVRTMPVEVAVAWSSRFRQFGLEQACPLTVIAGDHVRSPLDRARAALAGYKLHDDVALAKTFPVAFTLASPEQRATVVADAMSVSPELLTGAWTVHQPAEAAPGGSWRVSIIIPCWNKAEYTLRCIQSIHAHTPPGTFQVVVVDNGSEDATSSLTSSTADDSFVVVRNEKNLGFSRACNQGARAASSETLIFLNNDTELLPGWLPPLLAGFDEHPEVGALGARLLFPDSRLQHAGVITGRWEADGMLDGRHVHYREPGALPSALERQRLRAVTGALLAVRREVFEDAGGFDEDYWNGNEDVDLCLVVNELGWQVVYEPTVCAIHFESVSGAERFTGVAANRRRLTTRWSEKLLADSDDHIAGVNLVGDFSLSSAGTSLARQCCEALERAGVRVVTSSTAPHLEHGPVGHGRFRHRVGPLQAMTIVCLEGVDPVLDLESMPEWTQASTKLVVRREGTPRAEWHAPLEHQARETWQVGTDTPNELARRCAEVAERLTLSSTPELAESAELAFALQR